MRKVMKVESKAVWIGDPCYVVKDGWQEFCDAMNAQGLDGRRRETVYEIDTSIGKVLCAQTMYGDGEYGDGYAVDAGLLGVVGIPSMDAKLEGEPDGGKRHKLTTDTVTLEWTDGTFFFHDGDGVNGDSRVFEIISTDDEPDDSDD